MKGQKKFQLLRGCTAISASLLAMMIGGTSIAYVNAAFINTRLQSSNYKYVNDSGDNSSTYFKSEYTSLADLIEDKNRLAEEIASEGTVLLENENAALPLQTSNEKVTLWAVSYTHLTLPTILLV